MPSSINFGEYWWQFGGYFKSLNAEEQVFRNVGIFCQVLIYVMLSRTYSSVALNVICLQSSETDCSNSEHRVCILFYLKTDGLFASQTDICRVFK